MIKVLLNPDDWFGRHQGVCIVCIFVLVLIVDAMMEMT